MNVEQVDVMLGVSCCPRVHQSHFVYRCSNLFVGTLQEAAKEYADANLRVYSAEIDAVIDKADELGYEVITLPEADVNKIREMAIANIWPAMAEMSPEMAEVIDMFEGYWGD
ncbi:hypothetical protein ES703_100622 [subsurface metagenome]